MKRIIRLSLTAVFGFFMVLAIARVSGCISDTVLSNKVSGSNDYAPAGTSIVDTQFNFHVVTPSLWRSAQPNERSLLRMKKEGLRTIVNLRRSEQNDRWEKAIAGKVGLQYYYFPMDPGKDHDLGEIERILAVIRDPENQPVLVHCFGGKDRTGLVTAIYKIEYTDQEFDDIHREMLMLGYHQDGYPSVLRTIRRWCEAHGRQKIAEKISQDGTSVTRT